MPATEAREVIGLAVDRDGQACGNRAREPIVRLAGELAMGFANGRSEGREREALAGQEQVAPRPKAVDRGPVDKRYVASERFVWDKRDRARMLLLPPTELPLGLAGDLDISILGLAVVTAPLPGIHPDHGDHPNREPTPLTRLRPHSRDWRHVVTYRTGGRSPLHRPALHAFRVLHYLKVRVLGGLVDPHPKRP